MARNTIVKAEHNAPPITRILAEFIVGHPTNGWNPSVDQEAHRTFANWVGCAIGAAQHETVDAAVAGVMELSPAPQASLLGRGEKVDIANAALINGISSHTFDFDDTHLKTIIHPAGPVASSALALAEHQGLSGRSLIDALIIGIEVSCRVGNAIYPDHYDRGWHITGSTGMLGSAAACSRLLALSVDQTQMALGIAASQPIGLREQFGTMTKPFHPGAAAKAGLMAALLARHGFTSSPRAIEAPRGLLQVFSDKTDWNEITKNLGETWEVGLNTYKPLLAESLTIRVLTVAFNFEISGLLQIRSSRFLSKFTRWCLNFAEKHLQKLALRVNLACITPARSGSFMAKRVSINTLMRLSKIRRSSSSVIVFRRQLIIQYRRMQLNLRCKQLMEKLTISELIMR